MSVPIKHHYSPVFYLTRWTGEDGRLCQYSRPHERVVANRRYPSQTGFRERLYEMPDQPPEIAQQVESRFMQPLDTLAAETLGALEAGDPVMTRDPRLRSAWSRFILSMMLRGPEAMAALKRGVETQWQKSSPALETRYASMRRPDDPPTLPEYLERLGKNLDSWAMSLAPRLIDHHMIGEVLNNMRWIIRRITSEAGELLTSDRPVLSSWTLTEQNAFLFLPIGPRAMFVAVNDIETQRIVEARDPAEQVRSWNQFAVGRAIRYVYGRNDAHLGFVSEHFGQHRRPTLLEQLADRYDGEAS